MPDLGLAYSPIFLEHQTGSHPESPQRLEAIVQTLRQRGLLDRLYRWEPQPAPSSDVLAVHPEAYVDAIERLAAEGGGWLDPDTVVSPRSPEAAWRAAGAVVEAVDAVLEGRLHRAFCLVRPPGHHALPARAMGFCLFNNVAIGASHALRTGRVRRVLVADVDVHHGNGTQEIFYRRADVLFFSVHQFPLYPGTGWITERGEGEGLGYTVNVPLPAGCGDPTYRRVLTEVLRPLADRYRPDLVLVSAGYDGHWLDPLASMRLSVDGYADLMRTLTAIAETHCDGRMVVVLEGGYDLRALAHGVAATCHVLLEEPAGPDPLGPPPDGDEPAEAASRLAAVLALAVGTSTPG